MNNKNDNSLISVENLSKSYTTGSQSLQVLKDISFSIKAGEFVAVVGPSAAGKSTLLHCLASYEQPDLNGAAIGSDHSPIKYQTDKGFESIWEDVTAYRQNFVGVVFQAFHLLPNLNVQDNVALPLMLRGCDLHTDNHNERMERVRTVCAGLNISEILDKRVGEISGGEAQRVAIARAMIKQPRLILADEPTGNLDEENKTRIYEELVELVSENSAVLMVTHDQRVEEYAHRVIRIKDGEIVEEFSQTPMKMEQYGKVAMVGIGNKTIVGNKKEEPETELELGTETERDPENTIESTHKANPCHPANRNQNEKSDKLKQPVSESSSAPQTPERNDEQLVNQVPESQPAHDKKKIKPTLPFAILKLLGRMFRWFKYLPGCSLSLRDLISYALRDVRESWISLVSNVVAIFVASVLTGLMVSLLVGLDGYIELLVQRTPGIDSVHVWADYSTRAEPMSEEDYQQLQNWPNARYVIPNIHQIVRIQRKRGGDTIVNLVTAGQKDPETTRLGLLGGTRDVNPEDWQILLNERIASEIDPLYPNGLIGQKITIELRLYNKQVSPEEADPSEVLLYPARVVGIVKRSHEDRVYGSVNMVRAIRDIVTFRTDFRHAPLQPIDVTQFSKKTIYESVRVHFTDSDEAERSHKLMKQQLDTRLDIFWPGSEMEGLRYVKVIAFIALVGIAILATLAGSISILNTLLAAMFRKTSEIGLLRALGVRRVDIFSIYQFQSLLIGAAASVIGIALVRLATIQLNGWVANKWPGLWTDLEMSGGLFVLPLNVGLIIGGVVIFICGLAGFLPSLRAAQKTPMDALRGNQS